MEQQTTLDLHELIQKRQLADVRTQVNALPEPEIADLLFELDSASRMVVFRLLARQYASEVFALLSSEQQNQLLEDLTSDETYQLLESLSPDDRTHLFEELPGQVTQRLMNLLDADTLRETRWLLGYPPDSIGRWMTPDYVAVRPQWTLAQALDHLRGAGRNSETMDVVYVVNDDWKLLDALALRYFILGDPAARVEDIMDRSFISLGANDDREEAVRTMERYDIGVLPVVDTSGVLVGIVTFDDILDIAQEEVTEDFHKTAAVDPVRGSYRDAVFSSLYRKRISWLIILVFTNIFSGAAIATFEETIAANIALIFFLPLLIDSSGNAGSQAATLMVRALAMGDVKLSDWGRLLAKEVRVALALGLTMAVAVFAIGVWRGGPQVGIVVAVTMALVVVIGSTIGTLLPFILSRFRFDPATASAPLITSLSDISGVVIYFSVASWLLPRLA